MGGVDTYSVGITTAPLLGGFDGMLSQENLKFREHFKPLRHINSTSPVNSDKK